MAELSIYQQYIHLSRYARWIDSENRRETWEETVKRYCDYFKERYDSFPYEQVLRSDNGTEGDAVNALPDDSRISIREG